jgi:SAM-dependent methyltransferase
VTRAYRDDLAYIHDTGFDFAVRAATPVLLERMRQNGLVHGLVVDLGCGSGIWAQDLVAAGYDVLGIDISAAMIALCRQRVPQGRFRLQSLLDAAIPACVAVTALGEGFNYLFDAGNTDAALSALLRRIYSALQPGGLLAFDVAVPGRVPGSGSQRSYKEGNDWAVLVSTEEDRARRRLTRHITSFRKVGKLYRRDHEVHELRLLVASELARELRDLGFRVRMHHAYGDLRLPRGWVGFLARKSPLAG